MRAILFGALVAAGTYGLPVTQVAQSSVETASLSGIVRDHAGAPVRLAIVTLTSDDMPSPRSRLTDDGGRFSFESLPAGRFTLTSTKAAYVTSHWGARRAGRPGTPLILLEGERRDGVELTMPKGGVITGIVRDLGGRPVEHAEVAAITRARSVAPTTAANRIEGTMTDDRGRYRIFGLTPDEYLVVAGMRRVGMGTIGTPSDAEMDRLLADARDRVGAGPALTGAAPVDRAPAGVAVTTYYPGTARRSDAALVRVGAGEERDGVDFAMTLEPAAAVSGRIVAPGGVDLSDTSLAMTPVVPWVTLASTGFDQALLIRGPAADGTFSVPGVPPGDYTLVARWSPRSQPGAGRGSTPASGDDGMLWARVELSVNGEDLAGVTLAMQPGVAVSGRVVFENSEAMPGPDELRAVRISATSSATAPPNQYGLATNTGVGARVANDGTLAFPDLMPDAYDVDVFIQSGLDGWWPRSAIANGRDVLDYGLDVRAPVADLVVTFTREETTLTGTLTAAPGIPAPGYVIVVFPEDQAMWRPNARRIRADRPADDGTFRFERLPAGAYRVAALTDIEDGEWNQPAFLQQLLPASQPVTVAEGVETRFDIRIAR